MENNHALPCKNIISYKMLYKTWEVVGADIFTVKNNTLLCIIDSCCRFPIIEKTDGISADSLITEVKIAVVEFGLPKKKR